MNLKVAIVERKLEKAKKTQTRKKQKSNKQLI
jgi:hypothetical protein